MRTCEKVLSFVNSHTHMPDCGAGPSLARFNLPRVEVSRLAAQEIVAPLLQVQKDGRQLVCVMVPDERRFYLHSSRSSVAMPSYASCA